MDKSAALNAERENNAAPTPPPLSPDTGAGGALPAPAVALAHSTPDSSEPAECGRAGGKTLSLRPVRDWAGRPVR